VNGSIRGSRSARATFNSVKIPEKPERFATTLGLRPQPRSSSRGCLRQRVDRGAERSLSIHLIQRPGLKDLKRVIEEKQIKSIALPALGSGNGKLNWHDVRPLIQAALGDLPGVEVVVYEPTFSK